MAFRVMFRRAPAAHVLQRFVMPSLYWNKGSNALFC